MKNLIFLLSFLLSSLAFSTQALEFQSYVNKTEVALNETLVLSLEFQSSDKMPRGLNVEIPALFNLKDFTFLNESQSQKSSLSIINGKREFVQSLIKNYRLQPKALGRFTIAPMTVKVGAQTFQTSAFEIQVLANKKPSPSQSPFPGFSINPFNLPHSVFDFPDSFKKTQGDFKFVLDLNKKTLYKSEALKADWLLLSTSKVPRYQSGPVLPPKGFWKEEVKNINSSVGTKVIKDTLYRTQPVSRLWLFPLKTGSLKVSAHSIQIFSGFSFQSQILSSPERTIQVKDLPLQGRDLNFTGAVGSFQVDFSMPRKEDLSLNEPFSFKISFKGSGHPRFIQLPYLALGSDFQTYEPVQKSSFSPDGLGSKEFEILIVPKKEGSLTFPSITLSTFNPKTEKYVSHKSPSYELFIKKDPNSKNRDSSQSFFETPLKQETESQSDFSSFLWPNFLNYTKILLFFKIFFSLFFLVFLFLLGKKLFRNKKQSFHKKISHKIKEIEKKINQSLWQEACIDMLDFLKFILDAFQTEGSSSHWRQALEKLPPSLNTKYAKELEAFFKELEQLSFSSKKSEAKALQDTKQLFKKIKVLTKELSSQL